MMPVKYGSGYNLAHAAPATVQEVRRACEADLAE
jgi:hypothetical protein